MYFKDWLKEKYYKESWMELDDRIIAPRLFEPIQISPDLWISVQAGSAQHCRPKDDFADVNSVTHWEVALFDRKQFKRASEVLPDFRSLAELELYYIGLYAYVPSDLVQELFITLFQKNRISA